MFNVCIKLISIDILKYKNGISESGIAFILAESFKKSGLALGRTWIFKIFN